MRFLAAVGAGASLALLIDHALHGQARRSARTGRDWYANAAVNLREELDSVLAPTPADALDIQETGGLVAVYVVPTTWDDSGDITTMRPGFVVHEYLAGPTTYLIIGMNHTAQGRWSWTLHESAVEVWRCPGVAS